MASAFLENINQQSTRINKQKFIFFTFFLLNYQPIYIDYRYIEIILDYRYNRDSSSAGNREGAKIVGLIVRKTAKEMSQKSLTQFFKPLNSGGVKRSFTELTNNIAKQGESEVSDELKEKDQKLVRNDEI